MKMRMKTYRRKKIMKHKKFYELHYIFNVFQILSFYLVIFSYMIYEIYWHFYYKLKFIDLWWLYLYREKILNIYIKINIYICTLIFLIFTRFPHIFVSYIFRNVVSQCPFLRFSVSLFMFSCYLWEKQREGALTNFVWLVYFGWKGNINLEERGT